MRVNKIERFRKRKNRNISHFKVRKHVVLGIIMFNYSSGVRLKTTGLLCVAYPKHSYIYLVAIKKLSIVIDQKTNPNKNKVPRTCDLGRM